MNERERVRLTVEDVVSATDDRDPGTVREALDPVTDDGVVTGRAVETTLSDTAKLVATAETRVELAGIAHMDATATAAPVDDLDVVAARLDRYGERLGSVERRVASLGDDLPSDEQFADPETACDAAVAVREVATTARAVARSADDLSFDLERFESWVRDPERRYDELADDVALVDESLDELLAAVDALPAASDAPAADWADAWMRVRVVELLTADLRVELDGLRTWADREDARFRDELADRVDAVERRTEELAAELERRARPRWRDRFEDDLAGFEDALGAFEPPVRWERVEATLERHRADALADR